MVKLFISNSPKDSECAEKLRVKLEHYGYECLHGLQSPEVDRTKYIQSIESGIRASIATIVIWSSNATESELVKQGVLYAQQLQHPLYSVVIENAALSSLAIDSNVFTLSSCDDSISELLESLPTIESTRDLQMIYDLANNKNLSERKESIALSVKLIKQRRHQDQLRALLNFMAEHDIMMTVRDYAKEATKHLNTHNESKSAQSLHIIGVKCPNGHTTQFDKRRICADSGIIKRSTSKNEGKVLDEVYLQCKSCGVDMVIQVECGDYK